MAILRLVLVRLGLAALTLLLVSAIVFAMLEILPGSVASRVLGRDATPEMVAALEAELGLERPALVRYGEWIGALLHGDAGRSFVSDRPVADILAPRAFNTLILSLYAFALYVPLTLLPAALQALTRDRWPDHVVSALSLVLLSMPDFLIATLLLLVFVVGLGWLPAFSVVDGRTDAWGYVVATTLPAVTLAIVMAVYAGRMLRDSLIEVLASDHVRAAELRGLGRARVLWAHALPGALVPTLNVTALNLAYLVGGVVVVEKVFNYPGFGSLLVDSLQLQDLPVVEAAVMIAATIYVGANLVADLAAIFLNPRLRA